MCQGGSIVLMKACRSGQAARPVQDGSFFPENCILLEINITICCGCWGIMFEMEMVEGNVSQFMFLLGNEEGLVDPKFGQPSQL